MPFNGSGTFILGFNWVDDKGNTIPVAAQRMDDQQADIASGLSNAMTADGQQTATADQPFGGFKLTAVGTPTADADAATKLYVDSNSLDIATYDPTTVSGDAFDMDNMAEGVTTKIFTDTERTKLTGIEALADVTDNANVAAAGAVMDADFTASNEVMVGSGAGTHVQISFAASELLGRGVSGSLTNLSATSVRLVLNVEDGADVTDEANVTDALDGASLPATTLVFNDKVLIQNISNSDVLSTVTAQSIADLAPSQISHKVSGELTWPSSGSVSFSHSLGTTPDQSWFEIICKVNDGGHVVGERISATVFLYDFVASFTQISHNATTTTVSHASSQGPRLANKNGSGFFQLTLSSWKFILHSVKY